MKKSLVSAAIMAAFAVFGVSARGTWTILGQTYNVDTLYHATVGPGTVETELRIEEASGGGNVNNIFYTVTDLSDPYVEMRAAKAGNHMRMLETVPDIAERMTKPGESYFAGVNADFFNMGEPYNSIGMCVADGFLTNYETDGADIDPYYIIFDADGVPALVRHIDRSWTGNVIFHDGDSYPLLVNTQRGEDELLLYTPQWQFYNWWEDVMYEVGHTGTNQYGVEVRLRPVDKNVLYGSSLSLEVIGDPEEGVGDMAVPSDGYVLSAHGAARDYIRALKKGDIVVASVDFSADGKKTSVRELLGGFPRMLANGQILSTPAYPGHLSNPEPRTAVGYNSDKSLLYMLVVDGRKAGGSSGVTQQQLAWIMRNIGCSDAMNFDGGGSSTMYVNGFGVKNVPSSSSLDQRPEGQPRTVVNALFAVAVAPVDNVVARIEMRDKKVELRTGETFRPVVYAYNQYGVMISTDLAGCSFEIPSQLAEVKGNDIIASEGSFSGMLTATYNGLVHSVPVNVNGGGEFVTAGIADPAVADESDPEYYRLDGVRAAAPQRGAITVVRRGSDVVKELNY